VIADALRRWTLVPAEDGALPLTLGRMRYAAAQGARVAWYMGQFAAARTLSGRLEGEGAPAFRSQRAAGDPEQIRAHFLALFARDRANIEAGLYPAPRDFSFDKAWAALQHSARVFADLPDVARRRREGRARDVGQTNERQGRYPDYYLQNFHYQTGGWLSPESAEIYDTQVEILFGGAADAMRRIALGSVLETMRGKDQRGVRHLDAGCGNGRFLECLLTARPRLNAAGLDLSPPYADAARKRLARWRQADIAIGALEQAPFADASFDSASCVYLFHELPPRVRRDGARELARMIRPGGVLVLADALQWGDACDLDQMLEYFPHSFHEPYFASWLDEDLDALFGEAGFVREQSDLAFLTKVVRFRRAP
jgi:SAM-dependent methyltransferase